MAQSTAYPTANIGGYTETVTPQGELLITGNYKGTSISQTVACRPPCVLFIDTVNRNFYAVHSMDEVDPAWEFVKLIKGIV